jgi:hypothetical protein
VLDRLRHFLTGRGLVFVPWLLLAAGDVFADALHDQNPTFRTSVSVGLWCVWAAVLIILVLPGATALVLARTAVPAAVPATLWALVTLDEAGDARHITMVLVAAVATVAVLSPRLGEDFVDAASYGDEHRYILRPPALVTIGLIVPTWAVAVVGIAAGPLSLAGRAWWQGVALTAIGVPIALLALRALLRLAQRWLVFVPAGVVIHDHIAVSEPVLVRRVSIGLVGPARADTTATDLTAQATGLALEFRLHNPVRMTLPIGRDSAEERSVQRFLVTPTRPAAVMSEASKRRISIG